MRKTAKPANGGDKSQNQVRMDEALKARIGRYQDKIYKETSLEISFSSASRSLIEKGLDAVGVK